MKLLFFLKMRAILVDWLRLRILVGELLRTMFDLFFRLDRLLIISISVAGPSS